MSKTITTEMRLPKQTIDEVKVIAKIAGLSPESVIKLALATELRRWQKVGAGDTAFHIYEAPVGEGGGTAPSVDTTAPKGHNALAQGQGGFSPGPSGATGSAAAGPEKGD